MSGICSKHQSYIKGCPQCEAMDCQSKACSLWTKEADYNCQILRPERAACFGYMTRILTTSDLRYKCEDDHGGGM